jgi:hypothetical protein
MIVLSQDERTKFADYLEQDALGDEGIAKQMDKMQAGSPVAKMLRTKVAAKMIVVGELRSTESMSIG